MGALPETMDSVEPCQDHCSHDCLRVGDMRDCGAGRLKLNEVVEGLEKMIELYREKGGKMNSPEK